MARRGSGAARGIGLGQVAGCVEAAGETTGFCTAPRTSGRSIRRTLALVLGPLDLAGSVRGFLRRVGGPLSFHLAARRATSSSLLRLPRRRPRLAMSEATTASTTVGRPTEKSVGPGPLGTFGAPSFRSLRSRDACPKGMTSALLGGAAGVGVVLGAADRSTVIGV